MAEASWISDSDLDTWTSEAKSLSNWRSLKAFGLDGPCGLVDLWRSSSLYAFDLDAFKVYSKHEREQDPLESIRWIGCEARPASMPPGSISRIQPPGGGV